MIKGNRKLFALWSVIVAALIGALYMGDPAYIAFTSLLGTGLGLFSYFNIQERKNENN